MNYPAAGGAMWVKKVSVTEEFIDPGRGEEREKFSKTRLCLIEVWRE